MFRNIIDRHPVLYVCVVVSLLSVPAVLVWDRVGAVTLLIQQ